MEEKLVKIINEMAEYLNISQMKKLQEVLLKNLCESEAQKESVPNEEYLNLSKIKTPIRKTTTDEIRNYLVEYQKINQCSKVTVDNVRRNISSFFSWLEEEDYILKSPMRRIHKIKTKTVVKEIISDEGIERMRDGCRKLRDLAIIDLLYSTGIRVGELVNLDICNVDLEQRECVVFGKGDKERRVYFDAKAKIHLKEYLEQRIDDNPALFVTLDAPHDRLKISGVEIRLMKYIPRDRLHYDTNLEDDILAATWNESELENDDLKNYKAKAEYYIREHQNHEAIKKLKSEIVGSRYERRQSRFFRVFGGQQP